MALGAGYPAPQLGNSGASARERQGQKAQCAGRSPVGRGDAHSASRRVWVGSQFSRRGEEGGPWLPPSSDSSEARRWVCPPLVVFWKALQALGRRYATPGLPDQLWPHLPSDLCACLCPRSLHSPSGAVLSTARPRPLGRQPPDRAGLGFPGAGRQVLGSGTCPEDLDYWLLNLPPWGEPEGRRAWTSLVLSGP